MQRNTVISKMLYRFTGNLRCRIINGNDGEPYLERYHLFRLPGGGGVYLHRFIDSDPDRGLHNHPWKSAISLILSGSYNELRLDENSRKYKIKERILKSWRLNKIKGDDFHRIVMNSKTPVWTLFAHTNKYKDWGFLTVDINGIPQYSPHQKVSNEADHDLWWETAPLGKYTSRATY